MTKKIIVTLGILFLAVLYFGVVYPLWGVPFNGQRRGQLPLTPAWALECWLWEDDVNTAAYVDELLAGYAEHDIPVRTILIDSPWSLRYNDFQVDTTRYPRPAEWFAGLQDKGYRVVLWMTPMVNRQSKDGQVTDSHAWADSLKEKGFLAGNDNEIKWWKGRGGLIDYTNPAAMQWWRAQQQTVFDYGIDGWKLDGAATFFWTRIGSIPLFYKRTSGGIMTTRRYMDYYYREEYRHGLTQNPEFITLSRSMDYRLVHPEGFSPFDASPVNWVGDQTHSWESGGSDGEEGQDLAMDGAEGIEMAIERILASARKGYPTIGSDVAGFSGRDIPPRLYIRWAQLSTFCGLFMNGGHGERRLWKRSTEELEIIRKFSWLHHELIPYMYHYVVTAHHGGRTLQRPLRKGKYHYLFGEDFLVAPIYRDSKTNTVVLPKGQWRYFFDDRRLLEGPATFDREFPLDEYPVFVREGAIIPMDIKRPYTNLGDDKSEGFLTLLIYPSAGNDFTVYDTAGSGETNISYREEGPLLEVRFTGKKIPHLLNIQATREPRSIFLDGHALPKNTGWHYDPDRQKLYIQTHVYADGIYRIQY